ncbi:hypothetical protein SCALM49S_02874 [Streptomyces californicus]
MPPCNWMASPVVIRAASSAWARASGSGLRVAGGVVGGGPGRLDPYVQVGDAVLDGLERPDGPAELLARLHVLHGALQGARRRPDRFGGEERGDRATGWRRSPGRVGGAVRAEEFGGRLAQFDAGQGAGLVEGGEPGADHPGRVAGDQEQLRTAARVAPGVGGDHEQPGAVPVQDPFGLPVEQPGAPLLAGLDPPGPAAARPGPVRGCRR